MSEPVVYSEVIFKRVLKGNTAETGPLLKVVVPDDSSPTERSKGKGTSAHRHRRLVVVVLCILILTLGLAIGPSLYYSTMEGKKDTSATDSSAGCQPNKCKEGWKVHEQHCYFFSTRNQTWAESKKECVSRSSDLAVINNEDEQVFLMSEISKIMRHAEDMFWIGLNDIDEEGQWKWVDNTPYNEPKFWLDWQPDNWEGGNGDLYPDGEDCVRMGQKGFKKRNPNGWVDTRCDRIMRFICETTTCL